MFQIIQDTQIPFMRYRKYAYAFSILTMLVGLVSLGLHGFKFRMGVDFTGGRVIEYRFNQPVTADFLRGVADQAGARGAEIQEMGTGGGDFMVRLPVDVERLASERSPAEVIKDRIAQEKPGIQVEIRREDVVGPRVGRELRGKAFLAVLIAMLGILIYVGVRYEFTYALGGVLSLAHDVVVALLMCSLFGVEITIPVIAAFLTIAGYSINDTVVVFDRIREQSHLIQRRSLEEIMDASVNQTLSRTMITAVTVFWATVSLFFLGGEVIHGFAFAMLWGVGFGCYSSVYIASALALEISNRRLAKAKVS